MLIGARTGAWRGGKRGGIPSGWVEVDYVETKSTGTYGFDTGVLPSVGLKMAGKFMLGRPTQYSVLFGCSWSLNHVLPAVWRSANSKISTIYLGGNFTDVTETYSTGDVVNVESLLFEDAIVTTVNGVSLTRPKGGGVIPTVTIKVLSTTQSNGAYPYQQVGAGTRLYGFKMWSGSSLIRDFVLVRDTVTGEGAMCDILTGDIYHNQGTGAFIAGPDKQEEEMYKEYYMAADGDFDRTGAQIAATAFVNGGGYKCIRLSRNRSTRRYSRSCARLWKEAA